MSGDDRTTLRRVDDAHPDTGQLVDVVFVHGLGGDDVSTWLPRGAAESWLTWLANDIPSIAVWSLSYPAGATKWTAAGEGMALPDRANSLIPTMLYYGIGTRKIIFVCHSLGGLVVKQILRHSSEMSKADWACIASSTLGVAFLATPHSGSNLATFLRVFDFARPTRTALALTAHCPHLKELGDWYRQNVTKLSIETAAFAEARRVRRGVRLFTVVTSTSADPGIEGCITTSIDADHIDICKPASRETDAYRSVEMFIRQQLKRIESVDEISASSSPSEYVAEPATSELPVEPPAEVVRKIRELQAMGNLRLLDPFEVKELKMGILKRHYGVGDD
ncbi:esterase/lipase family protein [Streptomyces harbinensis]|uniref:esterase/lipase family protein n=1 Tax=Streptomyces harbinensis TaxID=1176198 RepID=UPI0034DE17F5